MLYLLVANSGKTKRVLTPGPSQIKNIDKRLTFLACNPLPHHVKAEVFHLHQTRRLLLQGIDCPVPPPPFPLTNDDNSVKNGFDSSDMLSDQNNERRHLSCNKPATYEQSSGGPCLPCLAAQLPTDSNRKFRSANEPTTIIVAPLTIVCEPSGSRSGSGAANFSQVLAYIQIFSTRE